MQYHLSVVFGFTFLLEPLVHPVASRSLDCVLQPIEMYTTLIVYVLKSSFSLCLRKSFYHYINNLLISRRTIQDHNNVPGCSLRCTLGQYVYRLTSILSLEQLVLCDMVHYPAGSRDYKMVSAAILR